MCVCIHVCTRVRTNECECMCVRIVAPCSVAKGDVPPSTVSKELTTRVARNVKSIEQQKQVMKTVFLIDELIYQEVSTPAAFCVIPVYPVMFNYCCIFCALAGHVWREVTSYDISFWVVKLN